MTHARRAGSVSNRSVDRSDDLGVLLDDLAERIQAGEAVDLEAVVRDHPDRADELRRLLPALQLLADVAPSGGRTSDELPLGELGDFRLLREVGRGGMGVVYEAEQISLNRRVALKVLPFAATMDPRQLQRFRHEAQAAAMLHHPNIVPVYGVGCERSVHFYAMQLIEGQSLAAMIADMRGEESERRESGVAGVCDPGPASQRPATVNRARTSTTSPVAALTTQRTRKDKAHYRYIAELIAQAADALEYAHQQGVIHRDIKPANLMLDDAGHLWVTDFGLARLGDGAGVTASGDLLGTLRYMSPEQALAKHGMVDHRTDVYSLGATLYELLTLRPAVPGADKQAALRQIAFEEPTPPRKLDATIPPELETIALKALAKEPAERYPTASEFADDLRRWLSHQTIRARRPNLHQRVDKWVRRHSTAVFAAAAALLMGTGVSTWQALKARDAEYRVTQEAAIARAVNDFLQEDLLGQAASTPHEQEFGGDPYLTVREAVDRAAARIDQRFQDQPLVEAAIRTVIGQAYNNLDSNWLAVPHLKRAVELRTTHLGHSHRDTLHSTGALAFAYKWVGRHQDSIALYGQIVAKRQVLVGPDHPDTFADLAGLAAAHEHAGQWETSVRLLEPMLEKARALKGPKHPSTLETMHSLARSYGFLDRLDESIALHELTLKSYQDTLGPEHHDTIWCMMSLAEVCQRAGNLDRADRLLREALVQLPKREDFIQRKMTTANAQGLLAENLLLQQQYAAAEPLLREAVATFEKYRPDNPNHFKWMSILGEVILSQEKHSDAESFLLQGYEGLKHREFIRVFDKRQLAKAGERIVRFYQSTEQPEKAREWSEKVAAERRADRDQ